MEKTLLFKTLAITILALTNGFYCVSQNIDHYDIAYSKIETMLENGDGSLKEAVFTVENAYFDDHLNFEAIYERIEKYADFCMRIKESGNITYDGKDQESINAIFCFCIHDRKNSNIERWAN